jgi:hypothetical protein
MAAGQEASPPGDGGGESSAKELPSISAKRGDFAQKATSEIAAHCRHGQHFLNRADEVELPSGQTVEWLAFDLVEIARDVQLALELRSKLLSAACQNHSAPPPLCRTARYDKLLPFQLYPLQAVFG